MRCLLGGLALMGCLCASAATLEEIDAVYVEGDFVRMAELVREAPDDPAEAAEILRRRFDLAEINVDVEEMLRTAEAYAALPDLTGADLLLIRLMRASFALQSGDWKGFDAIIAGLEAERADMENYPEWLQNRWAGTYMFWLEQHGRAGEARELLHEMASDDSDEAANSLGNLQARMRVCVSERNERGREAEIEALEIIAEGENMLSPGHPMVSQMKLDYLNGFTVNIADSEPLDDVEALLRRHAPDSAILWSRLYLMKIEWAPGSGTPSAEIAAMFEEVRNHWRDRLPEKALIRAALDGKYLMYLGDYASKGQLHETAKRLERAIADWPEQSHFRAGMEYFLIDYYSRAGDDPAHAIQLAKRCRSVIAEARGEQSIDVFNVWMALTALYYRTERYRLCIREAEALLQAMEGVPLTDWIVYTTTTMLRKSQMETGNYKAALAMARRGEALLDVLAQSRTRVGMICYWDLGYCEWQTGNYSAALEAFERARKIAAELPGCGDEVTVLDKWIDTVRQDMK